MITLQNVSLRRGKNVLLEQVNWTLYHKQRVGLIGANGCGKSTLFSVLLGKMQVEGGDVVIPKQIRFAHFSQEMPYSTQTALDFVLDGDHELRDIEAALAKAEAAEDGEAIAHLHEKLGIIDGYTARSRAAQLLIGLGFPHYQHDTPVGDFSGGWRVRLNLAQCLMCRSDILLLDEPTNHLDLDAVIWLEQWLNRYTGTLLLISHDRDFLDKTVDHIAHISHQRFKLYTGNYSTFEVQLANDLLLQKAVYEKQQRHLAHMQSYIDRFRYKASKARQAQSRLKAIERMDLVCAVQSDSPFQFSFKTPKDCANPLIDLQTIDIGYGDKTILHGVNLSLAPKERIAILGPNGAGKSTFIKLLAGELMAQDGIATFSPGLKIGYFAQHQVDALLLDESPIEHLRDIAEKTSEVDLRTYLGTFGFVGDMVFEPVRHFSGGEKSRLALALLVWKRPNLLLLDEPTNHLDLDMRQALSLALQEYEGTMLLVSHDRFLVRTTTDKVMLIADGEVKEFDGDLNDYQQWLLNYRKQQAKLQQASEEKPAAPIAEKKQSNQERLLKEIKQLETKLEKLEKKKDELELVLADTALYDSARKDELQKHLTAQAALQKEIETVEAAWLSACEKRE